MEKEIRGRFQQRHDIEFNWLKAVNFTPMVGEVIVYDAEVDAEGRTLSLPTGRTAPYTYERFKIGDGKTNVNDLPFSLYFRDEIDALLAQKAAVQFITWGAND